MTTTDAGSADASPPRAPEAPAASASRAGTRTAFFVALFALALALTLLGHRGIWDPDEGRYTNVALNMLESGDWLIPHRSAEVGHWTKPPLTYWAIASSVAVFGYNPWAARVPSALAYLACVWLAWRMARRLAPGSEAQAAVVYATMLFAVGSAHMITTDYVLAACEGLAVWGFVEARFGPPDARRARWWLTLMWAGFALAFLAKGPPGLVPLVALLVFEVLTPGPARPRLLLWQGLLAFVLIALPWYVAVTQRTPGLLAYFLGKEVVNRVATNEFGRHGQWYGWIAMYGPTLLLGTLPWWPPLWRWIRQLPASTRGWRTPAGRGADAVQLLLALWLLLPLFVFCVSRSRLPLYILPLWLPLALLVTWQRRREGRPLPRWRWLLAWSVVVVALQVGAGFWPTHKDAEAWAAAIRVRAPGPITQVLIVQDMARYGLHLHLGVEVEKLSMDRMPQPLINPEFDEDISDEIGDDLDPNGIWITRQDRWDLVRAHLAANGVEALPQGTPYEQRIIFRVRPLPGGAH